MKVHGHIDPKWLFSKLFERWLFIWNMVSLSPGWPHTCFVAEDDLQFLISSLQSQVLGLQVCAIKAIQDFRILTWYIASCNLRFWLTWILWKLSNSPQTRIFFLCYLLGMGELHGLVYMWKSEQHVGIGSSYRVGFNGQIQVVKLAGRSFYPLNHLDGPWFRIFNDRWISMGP